MSARVEENKAKQRPALSGGGGKGFSVSTTSEHKEQSLHDPASASSQTVGPAGPGRPGTKSYWVTYEQIILNYQLRRALPSVYPPRIYNAGVEVLLRRETPAARSSYALDPRRAPEAAVTRRRLAASHQLQERIQRFSGDVPICSISLVCSGEFGSRLLFQWPPLRCTERASDNPYQSYTGYGFKPRRAAQCMYGIPCQMFAKLFVINRMMRQRRQRRIMMGQPDAEEHVEPLVVDMDEWRFISYPTMTLEETVEGGVEGTKGVNRDGGGAGAGASEGRGGHAHSFDTIPSTVTNTTSTGNKTVRSQSDGIEGSASPNAVTTPPNNNAQSCSAVDAGGRVPWCDLVHATGYATASPPVVVPPAQGKAADTVFRGGGSLVVGLSHQMRRKTKRHGPKPASQPASSATGVDPLVPAQPARRDQYSNPERLDVQGAKYVRSRIIKDLATARRDRQAAAEAARHTAGAKQRLSESGSAIDMSGATGGTERGVAGGAEGGVAGGAEGGVGVARSDQHDTSTHTHHPHTNMPGEDTLPSSARQTSTSALRAPGDASRKPFSASVTVQDDASGEGTAGDGPSSQNGASASKSEDHVSGSTQGAADKASTHPDPSSAAPQSGSAPPTSAQAPSGPSDVPATGTNHGSVGGVAVDGTGGSDAAGDSAGSGAAEDSATASQGPTASLASPKGKKRHAGEAGPVGERSAEKAGGAAGKGSTSGRSKHKNDRKAAAAAAAGKGSTSGRSKHKNDRKAAAAVTKHKNDRKAAAAAKPGKTHSATSAAPAPKPGEVVDLLTQSRAFEEVPAPREWLCHDQGSPPSRVTYFNVIIALPLHACLRQEHQDLERLKYLAYRQRKADPVDSPTAGDGGEPRHWAPWGVPLDSARSEAAAGESAETKDGSESGTEWAGAVPRMVLASGGGGGGGDSGSGDSGGDGGGGDSGDGGGGDSGGGDSGSGGDGGSGGGGDGGGSGGADTGTGSNGLTDGRRRDLGAPSHRLPPSATDGPGPLQQSHDGSERAGRGVGRARATSTPGKSLSSSDLGHRMNSRLRSSERQVPPQPPPPPQTFSDTAYASMNMYEQCSKMIAKALLFEEHRAAFISRQTVLISLCMDLYYSKLLKYMDTIGLKVPGMRSQGDIGVTGAAGTSDKTDAQMEASMRDTVLPARHMYMMEIEILHRWRKRTESWGFISTTRCQLHQQAAGAGATGAQPAVKVRDIGATSSGGWALHTPEVEEAPPSLAAKLHVPCARTGRNASDNSMELKEKVQVRPALAASLKTGGRAVSRMSPKMQRGAPTARASVIPTTEILSQLSPSQWAQLTDLLIRVVPLCYHLYSIAFSLSKDCYAHQLINFSTQLSLSLRVPLNIDTQLFLEAEDRGRADTPWSRAPTPATGTPAQRPAQLPFALVEEPAARSIAGGPVRELTFPTPFSMSTNSFMFRFRPFHALLLDEAVQAAVDNYKQETRAAGAATSIANSHTNSTSTTNSHTNSTSTTNSHTNSDSNTGTTATVPASDSGDSSRTRPVQMPSPPLLFGTNGLLPADCHPLVVRVLCRASPFDSLGDLSVMLDVPLLYVYQVVAHLIFHRVGRVIIAIKAEGQYRVHPNLSSVLLDGRAGCTVPRLDTHRHSSVQDTFEQDSEPRAAGAGSQDDPWSPLRASSGGGGQGADEGEDGDSVGPLLAAFSRAFPMTWCSLPRTLALLSHAPSLHACLRQVGMSASSSQSRRSRQKLFMRMVRWLYSRGIIYSVHTFVYFAPDLEHRQAPVPQLLQRLRAFLDGRFHLQEISWQTGISVPRLQRIFRSYPQFLSVVQHNDPATDDLW